MKLLLCYCFLLFSVIPVFAQNGTPVSGGARGLAMGDAAVTFQDVSSLFSNQAGMVYSNQMSFIAFAERKFGLADINNVAAGFLYPVKQAAFGLTLQYYGFEGYNEQKIGLSYARQLMEKLSIGAQFDYLNFKIPEYGNTSIFTFEIGFQSNLTPSLILGLHLFSPVRVSILEEENLPTIISFGAGYKVSEKVLFTLEAEKDIDYDFSAKFGIEYWIHPSFALRIGGRTNPTLGSFGVSYQLKNQFMIDVASSFHQVLGLSPGVSIRYNLKKNN